MRFKIKFTNREIAQLALLSSLWAVIEIYWGLLLRSFKIPFSGALLIFLGVIILCLGRSFVPRRGTAILMGMTISFIKLNFLGGIAIFSILAIMIEVILVEIGFSVNHPRKINYYLAGALGVLWSLFHPFFAQGLLAGWGILKVYQMIVGKGAAILGLNHQQAWLIFLALACYHIGLGIVAGYLGWQLPQLVYRRIYQYRANVMSKI
ncbi:MAG TPA: hypothetical protein ENN22_00995 [bacterium]|nr:hypothetical protein [bacterium]